MNEPTDALKSLPEAWRREVSDRLGAGESVLAWFEPDLDPQLRYAGGLVVLTEHRLLAAEPPNSQEKPAWHSWALGPGVALRVREQGRVGVLELVNGVGRLAGWHHTAGRAGAARGLVQRLERLAAERDEPGAAPPAGSVCPSCGAAMPADAEHCPACAPAPAVRSYSALLRLISFARPRAGLIALVLVLTLAGTAASLVPPYLTMPLLDRVLIPHQNGVPVDLGVVWWYLAGLAAAAVAAWLLDWARSWTSSWVSERLVADLRLGTYRHLQRLSLEFFGGKRTGDLMSRVSSDTDRLCNFLSSYLIDIVTDVLMVVMTAALLLTIDPWLTLATLVPFPVIAWLVSWTRARLLRTYHQASVAWADLTNVLADTIPGIRVVKAFAQEAREVERFSASNDRVVQANDRANVIWSFSGPVVTLLTTVGLLVVWAAGAERVIQKQITVGVLTAFLYYITRFYGKVESLIRIASIMQRAAAAAARIFEILDRTPSVPEPARPVHTGRLEGRIELKGVRFKYGTREVLHGIDLRIEPGEMIGLVGPSGAGKTTLTNLICRFYDVAEGAILVDGTDVRSFPVAEYRQNIGIVLQEPFLFYGTVVENIAYGRPGATRAEVIAAARAARAHDFIMRLPDGYDSLVGERGQSLSGGERQRVSIARALLIDPRILILDEATSSVDTQTEREIQEALYNLVQGRTTIAIAHRLSTLRRADRLVVVEQGRVVEVGSHDALLQAEGSYARLHRAQMEMAQGWAV